MFNVNICIHQNSAECHNSAVCISFSMVERCLFGVWVVDCEVVDLQRLHRCYRGYFLHTGFVVWEHEWRLGNGSILWPVMCGLLC